MPNQLSWLGSRLSPNSCHYRPPSTELIQRLLPLQLQRGQLEKAVLESCDTCSVLKALAGALAQGHPGLFGPWSMCRGNSAPDYNLGSMLQRTDFYFTAEEEISTLPTWDDKEVLRGKGTLGGSLIVEHLDQPGVTRYPSQS